MDRVLKMYDDSKEILELRSHIDRLTPFIEEQSKIITEDSSFAERFALAMNQSALMSKKRISRNFPSLKTKNLLKFI